MRSVRRRERGSSLPETALVMGVLLLMLFGIIDFGRAMYTYAFVAQLAREGARWAIVRGSQCTLIDHCNAQVSDIQTYVRSLSEGATNPNNITVTSPGTHWTCPAWLSGHAPGCTVVVVVNYPFSFIFPGIPVGSISMSSTSQMVISQ
jgi:Flp pilus assembly protein TadG